MAAELDRQWQRLPGENSQFHNGRVMTTAPRNSPMLYPVAWTSGYSVRKRAFTSSGIESAVPWTQWLNHDGFGVAQVFSRRVGDHLGKLHKSALSPCFMRSVNDAKSWACHAFGVLILALPARVPTCLICHPVCQLMQRFCRDRLPAATNDSCTMPRI
ncbi:MAG TPA: hypothetical protein PLE48_12700 [Thiobacillus sp.]|nr:hypothetical protein [Thiobacillus sp.]